MNFSKENLKKIMLLIVFTILLLVGLQRIDQILKGIGVLWQIVFPFVLGAAMAFIINVPMSFLEHKLFTRKDGRKLRFARASSLVCALLLIICIVYLVVQVVVPELVRTMVTLARTVERSLPEIQSWAANMFRDNEQIYNWINHLDMNWENAISSALDVLRNGVGNVLTSTVSVTMGIVRTLTNLVIGFVFACYILLQKEKLSKQCKMALKAILPLKTERYVLHVLELSYRTFANFVTGQCIEAVISGQYVFCCVVDSAFSICFADRSFDWVYSVDSYLWRVYRLCDQCLFNFDYQSYTGFDFCDCLPHSAADRRKLDLSSCGRRLCGTSFHLGVGSGDSRRKFDGSGRYADLYSADICGLCTFPGMGAWTAGREKETERENDAD